MDYLVERVCDKEQPVTVSFLSKIWKMPASEVHNKLLKFITEQSDNYNFLVNYSVCGVGKQLPNLRKKDILVKIVDSSKLDDVRNDMFDSVISCKIYSISIGTKPDASSDSSNVLLSNIIDLCNSDSHLKNWNWDDDDNLNKCGILKTLTNGIIDSAQDNTLKHKIENDNTEPRSNKRIQSNPVSLNTNTDKPDSKKNIAGVVEEKTRPVYTSRKASTMPASPVKSAYVSRKRETKETGKNSNTGNNTTRKPNSNTNKSTAADIAKREKERKELEAMLAEDPGFSDEDEMDYKIDEVDNETKNDVEYKFNDIDLAESDIDQETKNESNTRDDKETEKVDDDIEIQDDKDVIESESKTEIDNSEPQPEMVKLDEGDGYITMRRNNNAKPKPQNDDKPIKRSFTIERPAKAASKKQSNLMSFFKKK